MSAIDFNRLTEELNALRSSMKFGPANDLISFARRPYSELRHQFLAGNLGVSRQCLMIPVFHILFMLGVLTYLHLYTSHIEHLRGLSFAEFSLVELVTLIIAFLSVHMVLEILFRLVLFVVIFRGALIRA